MAALADIPAIVCDNGSGFVKAYEKDIELKPYMCGDEAAEVRHLLDIVYPVSNGIIKDWEHMEQLWNYTFYEKMEINPEDHKILLTEPPLNPKSNRKKMLEYMFETYMFPCVNVSIQAVLTLSAQGLISGVVVDSGDGVTHVVPVYQSFVPTNLIRRLDVAGRHLTEYMIKLLLLQGYTFNKTADFDTVRRIKEKHCYVAYDIETDRRLALETTTITRKYRLPDGNMVSVTRERFETPEPLFNPALIDNESKGMPEMIVNMILDADIDTRTEYFKHIVLSGGTSMFPGLPTRLKKEMKDLVVKKLYDNDEDRYNAGKFRVHVEDPPRRKHMVFLGGAVLADLMKGNESFWVTKEEYSENGIEKVLEKFAF